MSLRSRDAILRELRSGSLNGISAPSADPSDPRHRRGAAAYASLNLQFSLDDFFLRDDGTLGLKPLSFLKLLDTPLNFKGSEDFYVQVNATGTGLKFAPISGGGEGSDPSAGGIAGVLTVREISSDTTIKKSDTVLLCDAVLRPFTATLPAAAGNKGKLYHIKKIDTTDNTVTIDGKDDDLIDGAATALLTAQYESITIASSGSRWYIL